MKLPSSKCLTAVAGTIGICLLGACGSGSGSDGPQLANGGRQDPPVQPDPPPAPPPSEFKLDGEVFDFETGMIDSADVNLWVQTDGFGYSYWWANGPMQSDGLGKFVADVPKSEVDVFASKEGYVQPCGVHMAVTEDAEVRVEMQSIASLQSINPLRPQLSSEPSVSGVIYEDTPNGRKPVAGARLWAGDPMGINYATTVSDLAGGFYLCRLPAVTEVAISKLGFNETWIGPFDPTQPTVLKVALEREGSPPP
jgi:hypothetical protein